MIPKATVLALAKAAVADRGPNYGTPENNFRCIADYWTQHMINRHGDQGVIGFDATDVAIMMTLVKLARLDNQPHHLDSWIDIAGYAACGANINCEEPTA